MINIRMNSYCNKKLTQIIMPTYTLWFSYDTIVAFSVKGVTLITDEKYSMTTFKHIKKITDLVGGEKVSADFFDEKLDALVNMDPAKNDYSFLAEYKG